MLKACYASFTKLSVLNPLVQARPKTLPSDRNSDFEHSKCLLTDFISKYWSFTFLLNCLKLDLPFRDIGKVDL